MKVVMILWWIVCGIGAGFSIGSSNWVDLGWQTACAVWIGGCWIWHNKATNNERK